MADNLVVIGGDAAGMSAASKAKREGPDLDVIVFEKDEWVSYGACGLAYYIKGEIDNLEDLISIPAEDFIDKREIDLRTEQEVMSISPEKNTLKAEGEGETYEKEFDKLLISTGTSAKMPQIKGTDLEGVYTLHHLPDAEKIRKAIKEKNDQASIGIIGGGYIGIEMAEAIKPHGMKVHLYEILPHVLDSFGEETAEVVQDHLKEKGIKLHLKTKVKELTGRNGQVSEMITDQGSKEIDMVIIAVGVEPTVELAEEAGIELGETGAIATDEYGRTNYQDIYAAGDCAEYTNLITDGPDYVPLALAANRSGRAIGQTVAGSPKPVGKVAGTAVVKVFDLEVARTGVIDHDRAKKSGFDPITSTIKVPSRAHYYPGGDPIRISLTADKETGRLIGGSMVGREGVAKRIDTIATALHSSMTVSELEYLDLSYAPPFGPVWDPVLTAAKVLNGKIS